MACVWQPSISACSTATCIRPFSLTHSIQSFMCIQQWETHCSGFGQLQGWCQAGRVQSRRWLTCCSSVDSRCVHTPAKLCPTEACAALWAAGVCTHPHAVSNRPHNSCGSLGTRWAYLTACMGAYACPSQLCRQQVCLRCCLHDTERPCWPPVACYNQTVMQLCWQQVCVCVHPSVGLACQVAPPQASDMRVQMSVGGLRQPLYMWPVMSGSAAASSTAQQAVSSALQLAATVMRALSRFIFIILNESLKP